MILLIETTEGEELVGARVEAGKRVRGCRQIRYLAPSVIADAVLFALCGRFFVDTLTSEHEYNLLLDIARAANATSI